MATTKHPGPKRRKGALKSLDMGKALAQKPYEKQLAALQEKLRLIQQAYMQTGDAAVILFEGWDTAGKGGTIRRITSAMDARNLKVWPVSAPRAYYKERHYLTRFWERLPPTGAISIFDRSWYGRVLVERVEGFAGAAQWRRAYREINNFERMLGDDGTRVVKLFLHITPEEQFKRQRLVVSNEPGETLAFMGWEVEHKDDLQTFATRLENNGTPVEFGDHALADRRFVSELIVFEDPTGNRVELFWQPMIASDPFEPGRPIQGFKTGPLGMGHAVLHVRDIDAALTFYQDILDFQISDFSLTPYPLYFFHVNNRHHSFAMVASGQTGFHHFMIEYQNLDDVGQGYDLAQLDEDRVAYTLGRHTNDFMTSFYAHSPSGFFVENGWGGRVIDPATWTPHETFDGPSFWGHERLHLPDAQRLRMRDMRLDAARRGLRAPPAAECPWLFGELARQQN